ncbi:MAG TPA: DUF2127 domain-containing protein [Anaeromyxobacteraceae bacterium]|nr:DUF2127 domain-containing protein [Anaeromyxobacteraceae bacterium]
MPPRRDAGLRLVIAYKAVKAAAEAAGAVAVVVLAASGRIDAVRELARAWQDHLGHHLAILAGRGLAVLLSERGLRWVEIGLALDAVVSAFEGFALWRGWPWGPWIVAGATGVPLPFELVHLLHRPRPARFALLAVNAAIVVYLARLIARRHRSAPRIAAPRA